MPVTPVTPATPATPATDGGTVVVDGGAPAVSEGETQLADAAPAVCVSGAVPQPIPFGESAIAAAAGANQDIFVAVSGGLGSPPSGFLRLDLTTGAWTARAVPPTGFTIWGMAGALGKIYGFDGQNVAIYDPSGDSWSLGKPMATPQNGPNATLGPNGLIYLVGYASTVTDGSGPQAWTYNPQNGDWANLPDAPFSGDGTALATGLDGRIYLTGVQAAAFDTTTGLWTQLPSPPTPRYWVASAVDSLGEVLAIGGYLPGSTSGAVATVEAFDTSKGTWSSLPALPVQAMEVPAVRGSCDGKVYAFGAAGHLSYVQIFDGHSWQLVQ
jgi:hypothetical protein